MDSALVDQTSEQFLGQWKHLVSTTNWEKGRIIHHWREALQAAGAPIGECSDDAWSRRVGNVTPQHVGRLRRVYERFGPVCDDYAGLFWSHFQAALDWDDAEMWLEGAVQSQWSISEMRYKRWETRGGVAEQEPADDEPAVPWDDDAEPADAAAEVTSGTLAVVSDVPTRSDDEQPVDGPRQQPTLDYASGDYASGDYDSREPGDAGTAVAPFADLPQLPPDVNDAFEAYKLCILRHKLAGWREISRDGMVFSLKALVQLALAPAEV